MGFSFNLENSQKYRVVRQRNWMRSHSRIILSGDLMESQCRVRKRVGVMQTQIYFPKCGLFLQIASCKRNVAIEWPFILTIRISERNNIRSHHSLLFAVNSTNSEIVQMFSQCEPSFVVTSLTAAVLTLQRVSSSVGLLSEVCATSPSMSREPWTYEALEVFLILWNTFRNYSVYLCHIDPLSMIQPVKCWV